MNWCCHLVKYSFVGPQSNPLPYIHGPSDYAIFLNMYWKSCSVKVSKDCLCIYLDYLNYLKLVALNLISMRETEKSHVQASKVGGERQLYP